ncbi:AAA family ATPase [Nannocystis punicea]|uniref:AAA family ATPase n=1 Tax=Nannocystis punicea TaxID=2995304 RepID=A0ABY7GZU2_9BACT|nr:AAA family ATPase [Nannocystis poenicansa]WAS92417.1 AAA family ATPase [Nannocystis poenicansa]
MTLSSLTDAAAAVRGALAVAGRGLVERDALLELVVLAAVAGEHLLVIGPPGTAKSAAVRRIARALGGNYFEYLLGRFTEPSEIFGPVDLRKLREGRVETETAGMLPEAEIAFLDEVFLGSTAILNALLGLLAERVFRRGHTTMRCPLRVCVGAANALPQEESLAAFADRFLVRVFVEPIPDARLEELLEQGFGAAQELDAPLASLAQLDVLGAAARNVDLEGVRPALAHAIRRLRGAGIALSDRRLVKIQRLVAAAAALAGRTRASDGDLWPIVAAVPTAAEQAQTRDTLRDLLQRSESGVLGAAAAESSLGPLVRAARIAGDADLLLARDPGIEPLAREAWRLKLEALAREIDASFRAEELPADAARVRAAIVERFAALDAAAPAPGPGGV